MRKIITIIICILFLTPVVFAATQKVYVLNLVYEKDKVTDYEITVTVGIFNEIASEGENILRIISFNGETLYQQKINFEETQLYYFDPEWFDEDGNQIYIPKEEEVRTEKEISTLELVLPYFENAKSIEINDKSGNKLLEVDVNQYSTKCPNNVCESSETPDSCPQDCKQEVAIKDSEPKKSKTHFMITGIILVLIFAVIYGLVHFHHTGSMPSIKDHIALIPKIGKESDKVLNRRIESEEKMLFDKK